MQQYQNTYANTSSRVLSDYDTEDPENYREINLFTPMPKSLSTTSGKKPMVSQVQSREDFDSYQT